MSETVFYIGKAKKLPLDERETLEMKCKSLCNENGITELKSYNDTWQEEVIDIKIDEKSYDRKYVIAKGNVYQILEIENREYDDMIEARENSDGTIGYFLRYYNGGAGFGECFEEAIGKLENGK